MNSCRDTRVFCALFETPLGFGAVVSGLAGLMEVMLPFNGDDRRAMVARVSHRYPAALSADAVADEAARLLASYFSGEREEFQLPLDLRHCTAFQIAVYRTVADIPYGSVASYGEVAARIGRPGAARGVGGAMARNPLPIVIPCHRVVGKGGELVGYSASGGLDSKRRLLLLEGVAFVGKDGERVRLSQQGCRRQDC